MQHWIRTFAFAAVVICGCSPPLPIREVREEPADELPPASVAASAARATDHLEEGHRLLRLEQFGPAMEQVRLLLAKNPNEPQARLLKGCILIEIGDDASAASIFNGLIEQYPGNLAVLFAGEGHYDKARRALEAAVHPSPVYDSGYDGRLGRYLARQAYNRSMKVLEHLFGIGGGAPPEVAAVPAPAEASSPIPSAAWPGPATAHAAAWHRPVFEPATPAVEALKSVRDWASAWSAQDPRAYLSLYAPAFLPPGGESRAAWEAQRRERITAPDFIRVDIEEPTASLDGDGRVRVTFRQTYRSSQLEVTTRKRLSLVKVGTRWLIESEHSSG
jgi:hypothetical protein